MTSYKCYICSNTFTYNKNLQRHLNEFRCKSELLTNLKKLNDILRNLDENNDIKTSILYSQINSVSNLDISYLSVDDMKLFIETYDENRNEFNMLLGNYIRLIIHNKKHPENHCVKYLKKKPQTYNVLIKDSDGNTTWIAKGLKDTYESLCGPILYILRVGLKKYVKKYRRDDDYDYSLYEDTVKILKDEFNDKNVKKALSSVLQHNILYDNEMKA